MVVSIEVTGTGNAQSAPNGPGTYVIPVTINVTDVGETPEFDEGDTATRTIAENTAAGSNVGAAVTATDQDGDTLTYSLSGTDASQVRPRRQHRPNHGEGGAASPITRRRPRTP